MSCLVTTLDGTVEESVLGELGVWTITGEARDDDSWASYPTRFTYANSLAWTAELEDGDAYFTDSTGAENYGTTLSYSAGTSATFYVSNAAYTLHLNNKYTATTITTITTITTAIAAAIAAAYNIDLTDLCYTPNLTSLSIVTSHEEKVDAAKVFNSLWAENIKYIIFNDVNGSLVGDITDGLATMTNLYHCALKFYTGLTGDISQAPDALYFLSNQHGSSEFTWENERPSSAYVLAMEDVELGDYIDAMLINQANCTANDPDSVTSSWYWKINVTGTRTSESDEAVETLKEMGYTVIVNGTTL